MKKAELRPGTELAPVAHPVTRANVIRYGGLVTGFNPLHEDEEFARELGFEKIVAHGVMHMNFITEMLCLFSGHPDRVKGIEIDFVKAVYPGDVITAKGVVREVTEGDSALTVILDVWSENQDGVRVTDNGTAEVMVLIQAAAD